MKKKLWLIGLVLLIGILFIIYIYNKKTNKYIVYTNYDNLLSEVEKYKEGIIYIPTNSEENSLISYFADTYNVKVLIADMNVNELKVIIKASSLDIDAKTPMFLIFDDKKIIGGFNADLSQQEANEMFRYYYFNELPSSMIKYKTLSTADEYIKKVNSKDLTVAVFGYDACSFCNLYKPVFNKVAGDYNLNIYYFDTVNYNEDEYNKILELDFEIPAECTTTGEPTTLANGFPKPMTLVTKKGKLVGCIKGYVTEEKLVSKLREFKVLESEK